MGLDDVLKGLVNISKVKLHGGLVGKMCTVLIAFCTMVAVICIVIKSTREILIVSVLALVIFLIIILRLIGFAGKNPYAALLEGAEFLVHEQIIYGTKESAKITDLNVVKISRKKGVKKHP